ncbi:MAG: histidine ammonia-lyase [Bacteroidales bacterium]
MGKYYNISTAGLSIKDVEGILSGNLRLSLSDEVCNLISTCREYLDRKLASSDEPVYGINTGFGSLYDRSIPAGDLGILQRNLVMSHACGTGGEVPMHIVRLMLLLKIQSLSYGHSGVQLETVKRLVDFFNNDILPVVYEQGSLGASGDLAPLAHLSLPLMGMGEVNYNGRKMPAAEVIENFNREPLNLQSKEGLALLNGTQFMAAYGIWCCIEARRLIRLADITGSLSLDAYDGRPEAFSEMIQKVRPHPGQLETAARVMRILDGSEIITRTKKHVQDPYSFRCIPQVHGASRDALGYAIRVFECEINSVTDNPTVFPDEDKVISGGNFHGQPLALALDFLSIAVAEIASISERRIYRLLSGKRGLPLFLVANPGLNSGFMIPQYTAASIVSQNKQLCTPSSVDTIESSQGQEDHVSMGANAALKAVKVVENTEKVLAIELYNAAQALEFRRPARTSDFLEGIVESYRKRVSFTENDRVMYNDIRESVEFLMSLSTEIPGE